MDCVQRKNLTSTVLLAGNSRVERSEVDGQVRVEPELAAFDAALRASKLIEQETGLLPPIALAMDHRGIFRKQFLKPGLSHSRQKHPRLSDLHPEILKVFEPSTSTAAVDPAAIHVLHEDSCRTSISDKIAKNQIPYDLLHRLSNASDIVTSCSLAGSDGSGRRGNCTGVTWEYFRRAIGLLPGGSEADGLLEVYFENTPWSAPSVYIRGVIASHLLGCKAQIRLNLVRKDGQIFSGRVAKPAKSRPALGKGMLTELAVQKLPTEQLLQPAESHTAQS